MKLRKILIDHFRGINSLELRFETQDKNNPEQLVVLAGPNGCGKTSVLEAILICLGRPDLLPRRPDSKHDVMKTSTAFFLEAELTSDGGIIIQAKSDISGRATHSVRRAVAQETTTARPVENAKDSLPPVPMAYFSSWRAPKLVGPVPITAGKPGKRPSKAEENRLWRIKNYFVNLKAREAFPEAPSILREGHESPSALHRLNEAWRLFYPQARYRFEAGTASEEVEEGFDFFVTPNEDLRFRIPVDSLSSGEIEVLVFLASFLIEDYRGAILLIDEPELHLHPAWHRVILKAIRSLLSDTQIICATHSPHVLSELPPEQVRLLKRKGPLTTATMPEDSYGLDANRILEELMEAPERPPEVKAELQRLFVMGDQGDFAAARNVIGSLERRIHADPALTKAEMLIRRKETLGK